MFCDVDFWALRGVLELRLRCNSAVFGVQCRFRIGQCSRAALIVAR
jgi:hypothetical protein